MKIKSAAIKYKNKVYIGKSHSEIGIKMVNEGVCGIPYPSGDDQGFVTDCGLYVGRSIAMEIAKRAGQIKKSENTKTKLFSEDLINYV